MAWSHLSPNPLDGEETLPLRAVLGCQFDYIWNDLQSKPLDTPARAFFFFWIELFEVERSTLNLGHTF